MLRTSLRTQQEQIAHEDYLRSIETEVVEDEIEEVRIAAFILRDSTPRPISFPSIHFHETLAVVGW